MNTKNRNRLNIALIVCAMLIAGMSYAQQGGSRGGGQGRQQPPPLPSSKEINEMVSEIAEEILLDEDQEADMLKLYVDHFDEVEERTKSGRPDRNEMESLKTDFENEVNALLTEDQQDLYSAYQKNNRSKRR